MTRPRIVDPGATLALSFCSAAEAREETLQMFRAIKLTEPSAEQR